MVLKSNDGNVQRVVDNHVMVRVRIDLLSGGGQCLRVLAHASRYMLAFQ